MQKDVHFNLTYALARKVGISAKEAEKIAWADQFTDDLTKADLHGIQTQSAIIGNWGDRQIQLSVLVPFHFLPGDDEEHPWVVTPNSNCARALVESALSDLLRFGIALHNLQDTFSHQGFSGWQEKANACFPWYYIESGLPNVGHTEMRTVPDIVNFIWTDPRNGNRIDNRQRALRCAKTTYDFLVKFHKPAQAGITWSEIRDQLKDIFKLKSYDQRKAKLCELAGKNIRYKNVNKRLAPKHKVEFIEAARQHLAEAIKSIGKLS